MTQAPTPAPMPALDAAAGAPAPDEAGLDAGAADEGADQPTVLLTVMDNHDGTYTLTEGDEPEEPAEPAEGAEPGADVSLAAEPAGKTFDSVGALLKGVLDIVKNAAESEGGESGDDAFSAGFKGGSSASPPKAGLAQKY